MYSGQNVGHWEAVESEVGLILGGTWSKRVNAHGHNQEGKASTSVTAVIVLQNVSSA